MSIPANVARCVINGKITGGEEWSTGFWIITQANAQTIVDNIHEEVQNFCEAIAPMMLPAFTFRSLTVYKYDAPGTHASSEAAYDLTGGGTYSGSASPFSCALVVTLLTGRPGRRYRGRMYIPCSATITGDGHIPFGTGPSVAGSAVRTLLQNIAGNANGETPAVVSSAGTTATVITSVRCDDLPDTQRRRDESLTPINIYAQPLASS